MSNYHLTEADREDIAERVANKLGFIFPKYMSAKETAQVLNISVSRLYQIKDKIGYTKAGDKKQSPLKFNISDVKRYLTVLFLIVISFL